MSVKEEIKKYIASQDEAKREDMRALHNFIQKIMPKAKLWYIDGTGSKGSIVTNPNIGYGSYTIHYAGGKSKEFYQIGFSANTGGVSVYIMGLKDKKHLVTAYAKRIGKASVTGYCIKFKTLTDINLNVLEEAIRYRLKEESVSVKSKPVTKLTKTKRK